METVETRLKRWGNSFGIIIPSDIVQRENMKEDQNIKVLILRDSKKAFRETFGIGKGKIKKSTQQIKDELRKELYD